MMNQCVENVSKKNWMGSVIADNSVHCFELYSEFNPKPSANKNKWHFFVQFSSSFCAKIKTIFLVMNSHTLSLNDDDDTKRLLIFPFMWHAFMSSNAMKPKIYISPEIKLLCTHWWKERHKYTQYKAYGTVQHRTQYSSRHNRFLWCILCANVGGTAAQKPFFFVQWKADSISCEFTIRL